MHTTVEEWIKMIYDVSAKKANELNLNKMLKNNLKLEYAESKKENNNTDFLTAKDLFEVYEDGVAILNFLKKKRSKYFQKKHIKLLGIETELDHPVGNNVQFVGKLDIILKDTLRNKIIIIDLKTSMRTWAKWKKQDDLVRMQLVLYKYFYAEQFKVDMKDIEIEFVILKRKLYENSDFPQPRVQVFIPPSGKPTVNKYKKLVDEFINECFDENGEYIDKEYKATGGPKICKWCIHKNTKNCPK